MARQAAVLFVVFMAVIGLACAASYDDTIAPVSPGAASEAPDSAIGAIDEGSSPSGNVNSAEAAPIGGPVPAGAFPPTAPASSPSSNGATALKVSAVAAVVTAAGYFF
ncbi:anther-specific protein BCP1-like [Punica granatum]|uniref:Uncharacterized protein n=2 Tax=Punica granatum TaxID=22663 RepID=A0A2I0L8Q9_PUNGR|nr:anther-specific protein BCP1-like [Punica granatum]PKI77085.1 hypothetical protein CRG98_002588 [Punica granatum]